MNLLGYDNAVGKYVKLNDSWLEVVGGGPGQASSDADVEGVQSMNRNTLIIAPPNTVIRRFESNTSYLEDEIDGIYMKVGPNGDSIETSNVEREILTATHKDAGDFTVIVPEGLLEERRRAGNGLAADAGNRNPARNWCTPWGYRTSVPDGGGSDFDCRRVDWHFVWNHIIARDRHGGGWSTVMTTSSIVVAFGVADFIGLLVGIYPAVQAAKLDPIEAIRYE